MAEQPNKKRKRGGLAGLWDRNKNILKPLATGVAGALTGGLGAAALGAAMGGLDRPGRGGIGLNLGGAARGALAGYGMGKLGQAGAAKLGSMFGAGPAGAVAQPQLLGQLASSDPMQSGQMNARMVTGGTPGLPAAGRMASTGLSQQLAGAAGPVGMPANLARNIGGTMTQGVGGMERLRDVLGGVGGFARTYAQPLGQAASAIAKYGMGQQQMNIERERSRLERERFDREREQQEALAELLMPVFQSQAQRVGRMG
jgi:hypothetical protein